MKPLSEVAPGLLVIQIQIQAVCYEHVCAYPLILPKSEGSTPLNSSVPQGSYHCLMVTCLLCQNRSYLKAQCGNASSLAVV